MSHALHIRQTRQSLNLGIYILFNIQGKFKCRFSNINVVIVIKILNAWFLVMSSRTALHATAKTLENSYLPAVFSAREAMAKRSGLLPRHHHALGVQPQAVRVVVNDKQNN